VQAIEM